MEALQLKIRDILQKELYKYIPAQELTHCSNIINKAIQEDGTYDENVLLEVHSYLQQPDKEYIANQTVNTKAITNNQVIIAMNRIRKAIEEYADNVTPAVPETS